MTIGNSVTTIGDYTFDNCSGLRGNLVIPNSVTTIGSSAFRGCSGLTSVMIGNSVTTIGREAFGRCNGLTSVTIPNSVTTIGYEAFYECSGLMSVTIPNSVNYIGRDAFFGCSGLANAAIVGEGECVWNNGNGGLSWYAKTLSIGSGITALNGLKYAPDIVYCNAEVPPVCDDKTFTSYSGTLHVPVEAMVDYVAAEYWQNFYELRTDAGGKVTLSQREVALELGETVQLSAVVNNVGDKLEWLSLNPNVAMVTDNGLVTTVGLGECDIIARLSHNIAVFDTCHVTVGNGGFIVGDVDGDGLADVSDVVAMINVMLGGASTDLDVADLNHDGLVDVEDVTLLIKMILNID